MDNISIYELNRPEGLAEFLAGNAAVGFPQYSSRWVEIIARFAGGSPVYFVLERKGKIVGLLPMLIAKAGPFTLANALPLGGSHGSIILDATLTYSERGDAYRLLFLAIDQWCAKQGVDIITVNGNPLIEGEKSSFDTHWSYDYYLPKITQINDLSKKANYKETIQRNVRKAEKCGVEIVTGYRADLAEQFYTLYKSNRERYGARILPQPYFEMVSEQMEKFREAEYIYALRDQVLLGALMSIKARSIACYQEPIVNDAERDSQANSLLLHTLLERHRAEGLKYWSWGASPNRECGVFKFKAGWGPDVYEYGFFTKLYHPLTTLRARGLTGELLKSAAPDYYVINYDLLK